MGTLSPTYLITLGVVLLWVGWDGHFNGEYYREVSKYARHHRGEETPRDHRMKWYEVLFYVLAPVALIYPQIPTISIIFIYLLEVLHPFTPLFLPCMFVFYGLVFRQIINSIEHK